MMKSKEGENGLLNRTRNTVALSKKTNRSLSFPARLKKTEYTTGCQTR